MQASFTLINFLLGAKNTIEMARIIFEGELGRPVTMGVINPISPLGYSPDMIDALMVYAQAGQPCTLTTLAMAGSTGPITLAGVLAQQNAELLAGVVLTQLIQPGLPVVYGSTSSNIDMCTSALAIGSPELSLCVSAHTQLARFYGLPSRGGGSLSDSSDTDAQSGFESMFSLLTTVNSGVDFVLHSAGIRGSYMAFSFEKFILDDEMVGMLRRYLCGIEVTPDTLAYEVIANVGHDGHFLGELHTLERCRTEFWTPVVSERDGLTARESNSWGDATIRARKRWKDLLVGHQDPPLDRLIRRQLQSFVEKSDPNR
jgi:trimethylamine--corrinoid protein Co-methyltransferase